MTVIRGFALSLYPQTEYPARPFRTVRDKHATTKNNHTMADEKIIFSMVGVSKTFNNQKKVLNDIYLSFFYGAKIGIIGLNGSGKSTLMKIIAGIDKSYQGEVVFSPGYSVGYLEQDPKLDDTKTVKEVVQEGCAATVALLKEYEEVNARFMEPMDDDQMAKLIERQGELTEAIDHVNGWELDSVLERALDALRCPDADEPVAHLSGGERRRVALCRLLLQQGTANFVDLIPAVILSGVYCGVEFFLRGE